MSEVIAVDLDEVVVHTAQAALDRYEAVYGVRVPLSQFYDGDLPKWGGEPIEVVSARLNEYLMTEEYFAIGPEPEAKAGLEALSHANTLWAVTGRPYFVEDSTLEWLDHYLPGIFEGTVHTSHYLKGHEKRRTKLDVCRELGATALVDDLPEHLIPLAGTGIKPVLHGIFPWSVHENLPHEIIRAETWPEVVRIFDEK